MFDFDLEGTRVELTTRAIFLVTLIGFVALVIMGMFR